MDFSLPAIKVLIAELHPSREEPRPVASSHGAVISLGRLRFQRVWLQGKVVAKPSNCAMVLDDGTAIIDLLLAEDHKQYTWKLGMYVLAIGTCAFGNDGLPSVQVHKLVDLSGLSDREALWRLEVADAHRHFYDALMNSQQDESDI